MSLTEKRHHGGIALERTSIYHQPNCRFNTDKNASHFCRLTWALGVSMTYSILSPSLPIANLGCWASELPQFTHVVGYSSISHFFLVHEGTNDSIHIDEPLRATATLHPAQSLSTPSLPTKASTSSSSCRQCRKHDEVVPHPYPESEGYTRGNSRTKSDESVRPAPTS